MLIYLLSFLVTSDNTFYCDVSKSSIKFESNNNLYCNSTTISYIQPNPIQIYVIGNTESNSVIVQDSIATFYLLNTNIKAESAFSVVGGKVNIILNEGSSTITSTNDAGISCSGNAEITISGSSSAKLTSISSSFSGIGAGKSTSTCKLISINGKMTIDAQGGYYGSGIGAGWGYNEGTSNVDKILIQDGKVTATSPSNAGIGAGVGRSKFSSNVGNITILGGIIAATGGEWGAGIGGGYGFSDHSSNANTILIAGGEIVSKGGRHAAGIGAGAGLSSTNASSVSHLSLIANQITSSSDSNTNTICVNIQANGGSRAEAIGNGSGGKVSEKEEKGSKSQCSDYRCTFISESTECVSPWKCDVQNCFQCSSSSTCSVCQKGYKLSENNCIIDSTLPTTSSSSTSSSSVIPPTNDPTIPVATEVLSIFYCTSEIDQKCQNAKSNWESERSSQISNINQRSKFASSIGKRPYENTIDLLTKSTSLTSVAFGITELQESLRTAKNLVLSSSQIGIFNIIIYQYGSMNKDDSVDFSFLQPYSSSHVVFNISYVVLTENHAVNIKVGDVSTFVSSLTLIFAEKTSIISQYESKTKSFLAIDTVNLVHSRFVESEFGNKYNISADLITCDQYSASSLSNLAEKCSDRVFVTFPVALSKIDVELKEKSILISIPFKGASYLATGDDSNGELSTEVASEQTGLVCRAKEVSFSLDPKTESTKYALNLTLENDKGNAKIDFVGENWHSCTFEKPLVISSNSDVDVALSSKPDNVNVQIEKREQASSDSKKDKKKLSGGAIAGISIAVFVVVGLVIFLLVYFLVFNKKKNDNPTEGNEKLLSD